MSAITVDGLVVRHGQVTAVDGVSFTVQPGEVVAMLGPNGAGKTSTIDVLEGYAAPSTGVVRVLGHDPRRERAEIVERIGVMLQDGGAYSGIRPREMLRLLASFYDDPQDADDLLRLVGLDNHAKTTWRQLSGGEQQRLSLAMAVIGRPDVAFLDEPTAGVDVRGRQMIRDLVASLRMQGCAVLLCTHELDEAEKVADRVIILDRGHVVAAGTLDTLRAGGPDETRFSAAPGLDVPALSEHLDAPVDEVGPGEYVVGAADPGVTAAIAAWLAAHDVHLGDLRAGRQRLEDVFLALTSTKEDPPTTAPRRRRGRGRRGHRGQA